MPTREEKKAATRRRLLDAAAVLVGRHGAMGTSLDAIAAEAGLTKGAVYSNFDSKEDLLFALADEVDQLVVDADQVVEHGVPVADNLERLGEAFAARLREVSEESLQLMLEIFHFAMRNPAARAMYLAQEAEGAAATTARFEALAAEAGDDLAVTADELRVLVQALATGLVQQRLLNPRAVPDDLLPKAFRLLAGPAAATTAASPSGRRRGRR